MIIIVALGCRIIVSLSLHYNHDNGKEISNFKTDNKNDEFPTKFCLGSISNRFDAAYSREVSLKGNVYDFSADYSAINKSDVLNIGKYLMVKNNLK